MIRIDSKDFGYNPWTLPVSVVALILLSCYSHIDLQDHPSTRWTSRLVGLKLLLWDDDWLDHAAPNWFFFLPWRIDRHGLVICSCGLSQLLWSFLGFRAGLPEQSTSTWPLLAWMTRLGCAIVEAMLFPNTTWAYLGHDYVVPFCTQTRQWNITRKMGVLIWRSSVSMEYVARFDYQRVKPPPQMASHWVWNVDDLIKGLLFLQTNKKHKITWLWYIYIYMYMIVCVYYIYIYYSELLQYIYIDEPFSDTWFTFFRLCFGDEFDYSFTRWCHCYEYPLVMSK